MVECGSWSQKSEVVGHCNRLAWALTDTIRKKKKGDPTHTHQNSRKKKEKKRRMHCIPCQGVEPLRIVRTSMEIRHIQDLLRYRDQYARHERRKCSSLFVSCDLGE